MKSLFQTADAPFLTRDQAKALTDRVLGMAKADETRISLNTGWSGNTRFAGAEITTSGGIIDTSLTVISTFGKRRASATTNVLDDASLRRTVDLAERLARLSPEDPELMPELGPQQYITVDGYVDRTAALSPEARAEAVKRGNRSATCLSPVSSRRTPAPPAWRRAAGCLRITRRPTWILASRHGRLTRRDPAGRPAVHATGVCSTLPR